MGIGETAGRIQIKEGDMHMVGHLDLSLKAAEWFTIRTGTIFFSLKLFQCPISGLEG